MTIRIASINETLPQNARFPITAISDSKWQEYISNNDFNYLRIENGVVLGFNQSLSDSQKEQYRNLVIPEDIWGETITSIGDYAFTNSQLTSATIPNTITSIGKEAFFNNQLTRITIPNRITSIADKAFSYNQLTNVTIPNNVVSIGISAFQGNQLVNVIIPVSVTHIWDKAFDNNKLTNITIPNSVTFIGDYAFSNNQLTDVIIPSSVASIGDWVFNDNANLNKITIGNNVSLRIDIVSQGNFATAYNNKGKKAGTYHYCRPCGDIWSDDLSQIRTAMEKERKETEKATEKERKEAEERKRKERELESTTFVDSRDGQRYRFVRIGNRVWMAENLNYKTGNSSCYNNNPSNCDKYGRLYNWNTAKNACPSGWRLPTSEEWWRELQPAVGGYKIAAQVLKSKSMGGTDDFGFSALPGGRRFGDGDGTVYERFINENGAIYEEKERIGYWWTSSFHDRTNSVTYIYIRSGNKWPNTSVSSSQHSFNYNIKPYMSVRCVRE
jgi:uncharacterized protein (TIGR02145 family)